MPVLSGEADPQGQCSCKAARTPALPGEVPLTTDRLSGTAHDSRSVQQNTVARA